jgi:hypothetical protein
MWGETTLAPRTPSPEMKSCNRPWKYIKIYTNIYKYIQIYTNAVKSTLYWCEYKSESVLLVNDAPGHVHIWGREVIAVISVRSAGQSSTSRTNP